MPTDALILALAEYRNPQHWNWRLTDRTGKFLGDHEVRLNRNDWQYTAFLDPCRYLRVHAAPDKQREDEARILGQVGTWITENVLGPLAAKIAALTPITVRVVIPTEWLGAISLLYCPLELAHFNNTPLALQDVSFVFETLPVPDLAPMEARPIGKRLRMLAVFSLPTDQLALNLRHERYQLNRVVLAIAQNRGLAIDLRVVQYGVTREVLEQLIDDGEGWDIVHFSGHGLASALVVEKPDGTADVVASSQFVELLRPARRRLKLVTLSACLSAAATVEETLRWLGIESDRSAAATEPAEEAPLPAVARALVEQFDCAVLAMRYPIEDEFAIDFGAALYEGMFEHRQSLTRALQRALRRTAAGGIEHSPLSFVTPALFGRRAAGMQLNVPQQGQASFAIRPASLAYFPREPERLVGRVAVLAQASHALAPRSGQTAVLLHGMAGAGKTACALELSYQHEPIQRFQGFVWYKAPEEGKDIDSALIDCALAMERQLPDLKMAHVLDRADELAAWLPKLTELLARRSTLIVLDNLESLLRSNGEWRDPRWGQFIAALLSHRGQSRTILTSRIRPEFPKGADVLVLPIHALTLDESALLARQLPHLGRLLRGEVAATIQEREVHRHLAAETLRIVQGHPKLIELAEGQAADPHTLRTHLQRATEAWASSKVKQGLLDAFFQSGSSSLAAEEFLRCLSSWTCSIADTLPHAARTLFKFLCCIEEGDRENWVVNANWRDVWKRLAESGDSPDPEQTLKPLVEAGLVDALIPTQGPQEGDGASTANSYAIHPGVAAAMKAQAGTTFQVAVDTELAAFWCIVDLHGLETETRGGGWLVRTGASRAVPYMMRLHQWRVASSVLGQLLERDDSPATAAVVLPLLRRIADATKGTADELYASSYLARALVAVGRSQEAEVMMRNIAQEADKVGEFRLASGVTGDLIAMMHASGRSEEALGFIEHMRMYTRRAGLGPWTQLMNDTRRLQLLGALGRYAEVLQALAELRARMEILPESGGADEAATPWAVREGILDTARFAAIALERWDEAISLNAEQVASLQARGATEFEVASIRFEVASIRFNECGPLLSLERYADAYALLIACRDAFERAGATGRLGDVFVTLAHLEDLLGHSARAIDFAQAGLRYSYLARAVDACAVGHFNLANYIWRAAGSPDAAVAHRLAAVLIAFQTASGRCQSWIEALSIHLASFGNTAPPLPPSFADLCAIVERVEGVRFAELFARFPTTRAGTGDEALHQALALAQRKRS